MFQVEAVAVGFMSVCSRVNMQLLHECFDLGPFHGLCTPHPDDVLEPPQELSVPGSQGTGVITGIQQELNPCPIHNGAFYLAVGLNGSFYISFSNPL